MQREIRPDHKKLLDRIRELYVESGGKPLYQPEEWGLNEFYKSRTGGIEVSFDHGVPEDMYTPEGSYTILGSNAAGDTKKFWKLFNQAFDVEVLTPQRNDVEVRARSEFEYQYGSSGPYVRITERAA